MHRVIVSALCALGVLLGLMASSVRSFEQVEYTDAYCAPAEHWNIDITYTPFGTLMSGMTQDHQAFHRLLMVSEMHDKPLGQPSDGKWHVCARWVGVDAEPDIVEVRRPRLHI